MTDSYTNSFITSVKKHVENLQYLAKNNPIDIRDIHLYGILQEMYKASTWFSFSATEKEHIETLLNGIVLRNSNITLPEVEFGTYYFNVNTDQTDYTWDRIIDDSYNITIYDLDVLMYPDPLEEETPF